MARKYALDSESETESEETGNSDKSTSPEEDDGEKPENRSGKVESEEILEYERLRLNRIADNKARIEALGLKKMAHSFMDSIQNQYVHRKHADARRKRNVNNDDDDYKPDDDDIDEDSEDEDPIEEGDNSDEDCLRKQFPSNTHGNKSKGYQDKKKVQVRSCQRNSDLVDEEDDELTQAIALSLEESTGGDAAPKGEAEGNCRDHDDGGRKKNKRKSISSRVKMTREEVMLRFLEFDGAGRGAISVRDVRRVAAAHDFTWTDEELSDMITCFDSDSDEKLSFCDFQKIAARCKLILESSE